MSGDEAYERARSDPDFLARFIGAYGTDGDPLVVLREHAEHLRRPRGADSAALYSRATDEAARRRIVTELEAGRRRSARVSAAFEAAATSTAEAFAPAPPVAVAPPTAATRGLPLRWTAAGAVALALLAGAYFAGAAQPAASRAAPSPTALPTVLFYDDRDGQGARLAVGGGWSGRRCVEVNLRGMLRGWSVSMACLSRSARPRVVPTQTVLLLDDLGQQIGLWRVPCDTVERRFVALNAPARPASVRLVLVVDEASVRAGWVSMDPTRA